MSFSDSNFSDDFAASAFDADTNALFFGADMSPWDNYVFGVAIGYDTTDIDTEFNNGQQDLDALTIVPYLAIGLSEALDVDFNLSMDMSTGYSTVDIDQFSVTGGVRVTSSTSSDRFFWATNINAGQEMGDFYVSGRAGILYAVDEVDGFTDSAGTTVGDIRSELGRITAGGGISYLWGDSFEPFVDAVYRYDYSLTESTVAGHPNDDTDIQVSMGLNYFGDSWSGSISYDRTFGRDDFDENSIGLTIRGDF